MPSNHPYHRKTVINTPLKEQIISEDILQEKKNYPVLYRHKPVFLYSIKANIPLFSN